MTEVPAEPPAAPPVPADASAPVTEASLQAMIADSEASVDQMMTAVGFDDVLAAVQPLPDSLPDLPRRVGELKARLRSGCCCSQSLGCPADDDSRKRGAAAQDLVFQSQSLEAENRRLRATNIRVDALLQNMKESTNLHAPDLELARAEVAERDAVIHALERRLTKEREAFKAAVAANTEQTRQLHAMLIKAQKSKFVVADTAHSLEDLQKWNTHLLHINRVLRNHVSLAGMEPEILVLAVQGTGRLLMPPPIVHLLTCVRHDW
ncbi:hypothetical protein JG688_00018504 [Phytophthora aleatoria]|uniref:Uncharacterized protein n=1 Tax=Phytophthora aleatoria TaxID=2496075 RepID=A0A8J5LUN8_9STRA|nr:hypothetical protein JG688_00018504 [Phytophthora aleatoria]